MNKIFRLLLILLIAIPVVSSCANKNQQSIKLTTDSEVNASDKNINQNGELIKPATEEEYQANVISALEDYWQQKISWVFVSQSGTAEQQKQLELISQIKNKLLDLVVPPSYKQLHLDLVASFLNLEESYQQFISARVSQVQDQTADQDLVNQTSKKFEQEQEQLKEVINKTPWLAEHLP